MAWDHRLARGGGEGRTEEATQSSVSCLRGPSLCPKIKPRVSVPT